MLASLLFVLIGAMPGSFLLRTADALEDQRGILPVLQAPSEEAARRIMAGGKLFAGGNPSLINEVSGRAAGLMLMSPLAGTPGAGDVVFWFADEAHPLDSALGASGTFVVAFGNITVPTTGFAVPPCAEAHGVSPTLGMALQAWIFTAELVGACTRKMRMPVIYESVGLPGGFPRLQEFQSKGIFFHPECTVALQQPGEAGEAYIAAVSDMLRRCERVHRSTFDRVGQWAAQVLRGPRKPWMLAMGHMFPDEISGTSFAENFQTALYNAGFSNEPFPKMDIVKGDVVVFVGYQHPPLPILEQCKRVGARMAYISIMQHRDFPTGSGVIWIDPMWPWADGCVTLPGYDIPAFPASGVVDVALAWEIDRSTRMVVR